MVHQSPIRRMVPGFMQKTVVTAFAQSVELIPIKRIFPERDLATAKKKGKGSGKKSEKAERNVV